MLKLIKCEFLKLKRKKFIPLVILSAFMFPIPLTYLMTTPSIMERYTDKADAFDGLFNMVLGYGIQFLLPCIIGVIAAMLFFMERDNDTFKNLRTIPVTSTQMVLAKILVLFLFGVIFCVASTIATILCGFGTLEVYGIGYKLFLAIETGIFITAGTLPLIVLVVFFSKTYVFSILLCVFYSVLNMSTTALFDALPKTILWLLPTPLTTFWSAGDMAAHGIKMDLKQMTGLIPSTFQVVLILGIMAIVSFWLIDRLYKQRGGIIMVRIVKTEFYKLKRYHILWAGVALMLLSVLLTLFTSMANDGSVWDFTYLTEQVIKNNMSMIFPMCISLIAGYMISREQTDDTLKNILTVPVSFKRLLTGKLTVCGVLSIAFGLICSLFTIVAEMIVGFPGFQMALALKATLQITAVNFFLYLAVLPIIVITCRKAGSFLVGVIIAFVYGYGGMFAAGNMTLANLYPITASLGMIGYRSYDTAVNWNIITCICSLTVVVAISVVLVLCMKEKEQKQAKKKAKKTAPKKGW